MAAPRAFAVPGSTMFPKRFERVVADTRFSPSVAFASAMAQIGTRVSTTDGDLTSLWFDDLAQHFAQGGNAVAGLTTARTALVMIELARGPGVRVLWRAEHEAMPDGGWRHELQGSAALVDRASALGSTPAWTAGLASLLAEGAEVEVGSTRQTRAVVCAPGPAVRTPGVALREPGPAVRTPLAIASLEPTFSSWVLAPRQTAHPWLG